MGRVKLEIKKIENTTNRQVTYSKRRNGLIKKAYELSVLCEIDIALIMFSPSGKPSVFSSNNKSVEDIIVRYVNLPKQERGRLQNQEFLQRTLAKLKCESSDLMNSHAASPMNSADSQLEEIQQQLAKCKSRLEQVEQRLRVYECDPCEITTFSEAQYRESIFEHNLNQVRQRRRYLEENCDPIRRAHSASVGGIIMNGGDGQHQFGSTDAIIPNGVIENWLLPVPGDDGDDRAHSQSEIFNFLDSNAPDGRVGSVEGMGMMMMMPQLHMQNGGDQALGGDPNHHHLNHVISTTSSGGRIPPVDDAPWTPPHRFHAPPQPQPGGDDDVSLLPSATYNRERAILEAFISQLTAPTLTHQDDLI